MATAMSIVQYIIGHPALILEVVGAASIIARITPTSLDDKVVDFILYIINVLALNPSKKDARED